MTNLTLSSYAELRARYGTLSSIQQFFNINGVDDATALDLIFNGEHPHGMREMEGYTDEVCFYILRGLLEHHKNVQAMKQEMMII